MKKTIIELEKEIAVLERDKETISAKDELMRKEISEALGFFKLRQVYYNDTREINVLSWFQIMKELGKLLAARTFYDFEGNLSELECKVEDLEKNIRKEIHPNLP